MGSFWSKKPVKLSEGGVLGLVGVAWVSLITGMGLTGSIVSAPSMDGNEALLSAESLLSPAELSSKLVGGTSMKSSVVSAAEPGVTCSAVLSDSAVCLAVALSRGILSL